jgi:hypothetical protein
VVRRAPIVEPIWDPAEGKPVSKVVFVGFLQGNATYGKVKRICDVYGAHVFDYNQGSVRADVERLHASLKVGAVPERAGLGAPEGAPRACCEPRAARRA